MKKPVNPWKNIPAEDYEAHMGNPMVGQLQALTGITQEALKKYLPPRFMMLGCCTGNGFEHVNPEITKQVVGVDINPDYLKTARKRYGSGIPGLQLFCLDLNRDALPLMEADLVMGGLILEYVNLEKTAEALQQIIPSGGTAVFVIQQSEGSSFVSDTRIKSLEILTTISRELDPQEVQRVFEEYRFLLQELQEIAIPGNKKFIRLVFEKV